MEKKILGLDLGVTSIGWALVVENDSKKEIAGLGTRIIPMSNDDKDEFSSGNTISKNQKRTARRTQRKGYDRYQLRRKHLTEFLITHQMFDPDLFNLPQSVLWELRSRAASSPVSLKELGRILYHINQKRGYKSSRSDINLDKKDTDYVAEVNSRFKDLKESGLTLGQKFNSELFKNPYYRIKQQVYPRQAYMDEFDRIMNVQKMHHPRILTSDSIRQLRDEIIFYQRKLKSQKGLVNVCEFEGKWVKNEKGKDIFTGPKVAHRSSPVAQICKIWETINSISIKNKRGEILLISIEKKHELFDYLNENERLSSAELFRKLGLNKNDGWYFNKQLERGLQGNITKTLILEALKDHAFDHDLLTLKLDVQSLGKDVYLYDRETGEEIASSEGLTLQANLERQPFYQLWHTIYSINDKEECSLALRHRFGLKAELADKLAAIDFTKFGFSNKSVKAMRKILPYLMQGYVYSDSNSLAGYNHSKSITREENLSRQLKNEIPLLPKNSLRQPVVEKILNQMIHVVNSVITKYGRPDEIRIELARELKQSREERNKAFTEMRKRERENESIRKRLTGEYTTRATRNNVIKWRLFHEINNEENKLNGRCIYCGDFFGITDSLLGVSVDVEHIIPKSLLFDNSQNNKTLSHRKCNEEKGGRTAFDYMRSKPDHIFNDYINRIDELFKNKIINKAKRDKLLMSEDKIPKDFIERQLQETRYIARKSKEILEHVCYNVFSTSGMVTEFLRRIWGWDDVLMNLQLPRYRQLGLTEWKEWETNNGQVHKKEIIRDWSKRDDHRHHAIDALVIACTQQGFIQRINSLTSKGLKEQMYKEVGAARNGSLLEKYLAMKRPFTTHEVEGKVSNILVSFKPGKKVSTKGKRKAKINGKLQEVQNAIIVPRGPLSEESVYGRINRIEKDKPLKYLFAHYDLIVDPRIRQLIVQRLEQYHGDVKKALASTKKEPIRWAKDPSGNLEKGHCYRIEYVIKYPLESIKAKDVPFIIDDKVKYIVKARLERFANNEKEAFKIPLYYNETLNIPIRSVRMFTGLSAVEPVKKDKSGRDIGFVKPGNNHHIAFYRNNKGEIVEHLCTFWHAVERKKYGLPVIIKDPKLIWDKVLKGQDLFSQNFLEKLPGDSWTFEESLQQNEMFIIGQTDEWITTAIKERNYPELSRSLYRVQKLSPSNYVFRHHLETKINDSDESKKSERFVSIRSLGVYEKMHPVKVRINALGDIIEPNQSSNEKQSAEQSVAT